MELGVELAQVAAKHVLGHSTLGCSINLGGKRALAISACQGTIRCLLIYVGTYPLFPWGL